MKTFKSPALRILALLLAFLSSLSAASALDEIDTGKFNERLSRINQSFESIEKELKEKHIAENELKFFYNKLIATKQFLDGQHLAIQNQAEEKGKLLKIYNDTIVSEGLDKGAATDDRTVSSFNLLKEEINQLHGDLARIDSGIKRIKLLLASVTYERIRIKSTNLFTFNKPFYHLSAWTSGFRDVARLLRDKKRDAVEMCGFFADPILAAKCAGGIALLSLLTFAYYKFSCKMTGILLAHLRRGEAARITSPKDILSLKSFFVASRFLINAFLPNFALNSAFELFLDGDLYQISVNWFLLYSVMNAAMVAVILYTVVSTLFFKELNLISGSLISSAPLKRRLYSLIGTISLICIINTMSIAKAAIVADPVIYPDGEAMLNLLIGILFCLNILMLIPYINWGILSSKKAKLPIQCIKAMVVTLAFFVPLMAFFGDSDIPVQFILKCVACALLIYIFAFSYFLAVRILPPAIRFLARLLNKTALLDDRLHNVDEYEMERRPPPPDRNLLDYWIKILAAAIMLPSLLILILLAWGFPSEAIIDVIKTAFFNDIPIAGRSTFSISLFLFSALSAIATYYFFNLLRYVSDRRVFPYTSLNPGTRHAIKTTIGYVGILVSVVIFIYSLGINMTALTFIISGLSVGVGFSLQELFKNLFSGFVLLVERPVTIGDILNIDGTSAVVKKIRIRSTILETANKDIMVIPNSSLINSKLVNETTFTLSRVDIQVSVASSEDPRRIIEILKQAVDSHQKTSKTIKPVVELLRFDGGSLDFTVKVHAKRLERAEVASELKILIFLAFRDNHVALNEENKTSRHQER